MSSATFKEMGLFEHLAELRKRIFISIIAVFVGGLIAYSFTPEIFALLCQPYFENFPNAALVGTGPFDAFVLKIKSAALAGALLSSPVIFWQVWLFVTPGLYDNEKKLVFPFVFSTTSLFFLGVSFCYYGVVPVALAFSYEQFTSIKLTPQVTIDEYLSAVVTALLAFGAIFELPILAYFLARLGLITDRMMIDAFRYATVIIFVISAVLTPPDVLSQFLMAGPLMILYGVSILIVRFSQPKDTTAAPPPLPPH